MRINPLSEHPHLYTYEPPYHESLNCPCIWIFTWKIRSFELLKHPLFCLMVLGSFVKINLLMDPLKSPATTYSHDTYFLILISFQTQGVNNTNFSSPCGFSGNVITVSYAHVFEAPCAKRFSYNFDWLQLVDIEKVHSLTLYLI